MELAVVIKKGVKGVEKHIETLAITYDYFSYDGEALFISEHTKVTDVTNAYSC